MPTVCLPTPLRPYADKQKEVQVQGATVDAALHALIERFPDLQQHMYSENGTLRSFVNVYVNDEDIRHLHHGATPLGPQDVVRIIPSIAGGRP